ncbi:MAG: tRNA (adenosine(37)-N6)-dimethylallyltransferase MiaA, partial [Deltaproteobacteria bacterium]
MLNLNDIPPSRPVLIAGPTASGKSALALRIAVAQGRRVVNADALQCYDHWPILSAQPPKSDREAAPHLLYGHIDRAVSYSVGDWLRDVEPLLADNPVIVGGTGLFFTALTEGLAKIPPVPADIRRQGEDRLAEIGLSQVVAELDDDTRAKIDTNNPARVMRAWEVLNATGQGLAVWQKTTTHAILPANRVTRLCLTAPPDWLNPRIARRFNEMLEEGVLLEAQANLPDFDFTRPSDRAIGAKELISCVKSDIS